MYYIRKLSAHNLNLFEMQTKKAHCYIWNEIIASRGANEIASCLFAYSEEVAKIGKKTIIIFCDN